MQPQDEVHVVLEKKSWKEAKWNKLDAEGSRAFRRKKRRNRKEQGKQQDSNIKQTELPKSHVLTRLEKHSPKIGDNGHCQSRQICQKIIYTPAPFPNSSYIKLCRSVYFFFSNLFTHSSPIRKKSSKDFPQKENECSKEKKNMQEDLVRHSVGSEQHMRCVSQLILCFIIKPLF